MPVLSNAKNEMFAQGIFKGLSQRKAYRAAFPNSVNWKDSTVDNKASELYRIGEIQGRLRELKEEAANDSVKSVIERKIWLSELIDGEHAGMISDRLKALDILNKMDGVYVAKVEGSITVKLEDLI